MCEHDLKKRDRRKADNQSQHIMLICDCNINLLRDLLLCRYPSDDINKFLWMVRIGGGVFPEIKEKDYLGNGNYRVDAEAGKVSGTSPS